MLRTARIAAISALAAAAVGSGLASDAGAKRPSACIDKLIVDRQEDFVGGDAPYLRVNTKFWERTSGVREKRWLTVFRTVHVGDVVQAWDADSPDPDDFIGSDKVGGGRGTLVFEGDDAKYRAVYHRGAC
jgi:hypothetical protein